MRIFIRVLKDARNYWKYLIPALACLLLATAIQLTTPQIVRRLIALITEGEGDVAGGAVLCASVLLLLYLVEWGATFVHSYYKHCAAWKYVSDLRVRVYDHLQKLSLRFYHNRQTGQLMSIAGNDTRDLEELIAHAAPDMLVSILTFVGVLLILFWINPILAGFTLLTMPLSAFLVSRFTNKVFPLFRKARQKQAELYAVLHDNLNGLKEIQTFNQQENEHVRVKAASEAHRDLNLNALRMSAFFHPAVAFVTHFGTVLVVGIGGILASRGQVPVADIVAFMLYLSLFYTPINTMARLNEGLQSTLACAERILNLLDEEPDVKERKDAAVLHRVQGEIRLEDVSFSYIDGTDVLKHVSLTIQPGELVALVGHTGVGKTTIASLINRFYDVNSGRITIDGTDIRDVTLHSLRDNISVVLQDIYLFNGTIAENIAYGCQKATRGEVIQAAKNANAHAFIMEMPEGYDTIVGERGLKLSGGQKQRISIARALLRNTPILILDEATASVDMETERLIHEAIDGIIENRTTIMIAHRLASVKKADKIVVLEDGAIAEMGTHETLLRQNGIYAKLYEIQVDERGE